MAKAEKVARERAPALEQDEDAVVALANPANFANRFYLVADNQRVRIAFMEKAMAGAPTVFQGATVLARQDAIALHEKLGQILAMTENHPGGTSIKLN